MVVGWEGAEQLNNRAMENAGIYLRLVNDGDKAVVAFCGKPYSREAHWTGAAYEDCPGKGCEHCDAGIRVTVRHACNVYSIADKVMKIIEGGPKWFADLLTVRKKYGLDKWAFELERHGAANSPKTKYSILPDVQLSPEQQRQIASVALHDLVRDTSAAAEAAFAIERAANQGVGRKTQEVGTQAPIATEVARELHQRLLALPREDATEFFRSFGINRVTLLMAADESRARAFIEEREGLPF